MTELLTMVQERADEFNTHYAFAVSLQNGFFAGEPIGSTRLSVQHLLTMNSGLIVHLYNVVEAVMSHATKIVESAFGTVPPKAWSDNARREWLREHGVARVEGNADTRLKQVESFSRRLLAERPLGSQPIRKPSGSWSDKNIGIFASRLGVNLPIQPDLYKKLAKRDSLGERGPLAFLADRRNDLAHGRRTFEGGAKDLTLALIREIADVALEYMTLVATSFQAYVDQRQFMAVT